MDTLALKNQLILGEDYVLIWIEQFLKAKKAENKARGTIIYYKNNLKLFTDYLDSQEVKFISQISPTVLRDFLLILEERGHNPGGVQSYYRAVQAFLKWYWEEEEPTRSNPINKVKPPRVPVVAREGVTREEFQSLMDECGNGFVGERDRAVLSTLLDTGVRAEELCSITLEDINLIDNSILIQQGKGRKPRYVFFGKSTRKQIRRYLKYRGIEGKYLFTTRSREKLAYSGLRQIVRRLGDKAGVDVSLHDFRRGIRKGLWMLSIMVTIGWLSIF